MRPVAIACNVYVFYAVYVKYLCISEILTMFNYVLFELYFSVPATAVLLDLILAEFSVTFVSNLKIHFLNFWWAIMSLPGLNS